MDLKLQKKLASEILKVGINKIWLNHEKEKEIKEGITKADIRVLIQKGYIKARRYNERSKVRVRKRHIQRKKGRRRGPGKRKGKLGARAGKKETWMKKIRAQRKLLQKLKEKKILPQKEWRKIYRMAKGGFFRTKAHLKLYLEKLGVKK